jgi:hypothetical protein
MCVGLPAHSMLGSHPWNRLFTCTFSAGPSATGDPVISVESLMIYLY